MNVRAKFIVTEKTESQPGVSVKLHPVTGGSKENETFYKYTPAGSTELSTINKTAADAFVVGTECYVDFSPVPVDA